MVPALVTILTAHGGGSGLPARTRGGCFRSLPHDSGLGDESLGHASAVPTQAPPTSHVTRALSSSQTRPRIWPQPLDDGHRVAMVTVGAAAGAGLDARRRCRPAIVGVSWLPYPVPKAFQRPWGDPEFSISELVSQIRFPSLDILLVP